MTDSIPSDRANYEIRVNGHLSETWSQAFDGMEVKADFSSDGSPITVLTGLVVDQPALHAVVARIRDLGLTLLLVKYLGSEQGQDRNLDLNELQ